MAEYWINEVLQGAKSYEELREELPALENLHFLVEKIKTGCLKQRKKACTILAREKGISNSAIADILHSSRQTTRKYFVLYTEQGLSKLFQRYSDPNTKRTEEQDRRTKRLLQLLHHKPNGFGINRTSWSRPSLALAYEKEFGERISRATISRSIKRAGFAWKKAKRVLTSPDPHYREKVELVLSTLHSLGENEQFFFVDELGPLLVKKRGGRQYVPTNRTLSCPRRQTPKGSVTLVAALSATTNQMTWIFGESKDTSSMIAVIEILFSQYNEKSKLYLTWDAVSWHTSNALLEWLDSFNDVTRAAATGPIIELVPLPTSAQFLNVIEGVFSGMIRAVVHNSDYQSEEAMRLAISRHFCERNEFFAVNPKRVGKKIWEIDFFRDQDDLRSGNYRDW